MKMAITERLESLNRNAFSKHPVEKKLTFDHLHLQEASDLQHRSHILLRNFEGGSVAKVDDSLDGIRVQVLEADLGTLGTGSRRRLAFPLEGGAEVVGKGGENVLLSRDSRFADDESHVGEMRAEAKRVQGGEEEEGVPLRGVISR